MTQVPAANWAESFHYGFKDCRYPSSVEDISEIVARSAAVKTLGSRHSFNAIVDGSSAMSLERMPIDPVVENNGRQVSVAGHCTYGELALFLERHQLAIHNLASLPHISIAGAIATATHGSGDKNGNLATAVSGLEFVAGDGSLVKVKRGDADFEGMVVHLGALGVVTRVTLDVQPEFQVVQHVYEGLGWDALIANLDAVMAAAYSVSVFTQWGEKAGAVWLKETEKSGDHPDALNSAVNSGIKRHPIIGLDPENATEQLGEFGRWSDRLPHFKMGFTPSSGAEIQSEYHMPRRHGAAAVEALLSIRSKFVHLVQASELRTVAADSLWLSPQFERDTLSIHFTWVRDQAAVDAAAAEIEQALAPFSPLPHWGKVFTRHHVGRNYAKLPDFARLRERMDPDRKFSNPWLEEVVFGTKA
jgi:alditol oxidase